VVTPQLSSGPLARNNKKVCMDKRTFFAATRSFTQANTMYNQFISTTPRTDVRDFNHYPVSQKGVYHFLWLALLFNVCASLKGQSAIPNSIADDLESIYEPLRDFRHVIFHIPPEYFDDRFNILLQPSAFDKCVRIHEALSEFFADGLAKYGETTTLSPP
jgi:hypothetical protein